MTMPQTHVAEGINIPDVAVDDLPRLGELLGGDVETVFAEHHATVIRNVLDKRTPYDAARSIRLVLMIRPNDVGPTSRGRSAHLTLADPVVVLAKPNLPKSGLIAFRQEGRVIKAVLVQGDRDPMPEVPAHLVITALCQRRLSELAEGYLEMAFRKALVSVLANIADDRAVTAFVRKIHIRIDYKTDEDRATLLPQVKPIEVTLAGVREAKPELFYLERDRSGQLSLVDEPLGLTGTMDEPVGLGRQATITN
jgi:hypothetical protein